jgi:hypothetical protein
VAPLVRALRLSAHDAAEECFITAYDATLVERPRVLAGHGLQGIIEETFAVSGTPAYGALTRR